MVLGGFRSSHVLVTTFYISVSRAYLVTCKTAKPAKKRYEMRMCIS